jgi:hypothetical protein
LIEIEQVAMAYTQHHGIMVQKVQLEEKERELKALSDTSGPSGHQKLQVCDTCGAYLSRLDNDRRLADHFYGKMHMGYSIMRKESERLQKELQGRTQPMTGRGYNDDHDNNRRDNGYSGGYLGGYSGGRGGGPRRGGRGGGGGYGGGSRW